MINSVGQQNISSTAVIPQTNTQQNKTKPVGYEAPPAQSSVPPLHEYVKRNQMLNMAGAAVIGTVLGILDAKTKLDDKIKMKRELIGEDVDDFDKLLNLENLPKEGEKLKETAAFKDLFSSKQFYETFKNVGTKVLCAAGLLYAGDLLFQKIFKTNQQYEDYYQENLKNK